MTNKLLNTMVYNLGSPLFRLHYATDVKYTNKQKENTQNATKHICTIHFTFLFVATSNYFKNHFELNINSKQKEWNQRLSK